MPGRGEGQTPLAGPLLYTIKKVGTTKRETVDLCCSVTCQTDSANSKQQQLGSSCRFRAKQDNPGDTSSGESVSDN